MYQPLVFFCFTSTCDGPPVEIRGIFSLLLPQGKLGGCAYDCQSSQLGRGITVSTGPQDTRKIQKTKALDFAVRARSLSLQELQAMYRKHGS